MRIIPVFLFLFLRIIRKKEKNMRSIWFDGVKAPDFPKLRGDLRCDTLIIGGGITGIMCAEVLARSGVDYAVVTAGKICDGTTSHTTGKVTVQHGLLYDKLIKRRGLEIAEGYIFAAEEAQSHIFRMSEDIDCDFKVADSYVYTRANRTLLENECRAYERLGRRAELTNTAELPISTAGAVVVKNQGYFNPLKFLYTVARNLNIYEDTRVTKIEDGCVLYDRGRITAENIIVATHFPILNKLGGYFIKLYQDRSYVLALSGAGHISGMYVDGEHGGFSFRPYGGTLLLGGGAHRTGGSGGGFSVLENFAQKHYTGAEITHRWAAEDCITLDDAPYIGKYSRRRNRLFVATGFNKWGMTSSVAAAKLLADAVLEKQNDLLRVFSPVRGIVYPRLFSNLFHSAWGLVRPTVPRCTHLGCALKYNRWEHSWDCPCHGSRFSGEGEILDGPADKKL